MKNATAVASVSRSGTFDRSEAETLAIDADGLHFILDLLSKQYSNPFKAIVREYSCNARDSHVQAGQTRPIEVTLPTPLDPQFKVQDWGIGLSREEILKVYAPYGSSTKRDSNAMIGAFGIGAKSAFAVSNEFLVTGVKDGHKTVALFSRSDEGRPTVQILLDAPTDEDNGVTVEIGTANVPAVCEAATWLFSHWEKGSVLIDGEEPATIWDNVETIDKSNDIYLSWNAQAGSKVKFVMGYVPYDIPEEAIRELPGNIIEFLRNARSTGVTYLIKVPIGAVHITPSREELMITEHTTETLTHKLTLLTQGIEKWMSTQLNASPNIWEAARFYRKLAVQLNYTARADKVTWKGKTLGVDNVRLNYPTYSLRNRNRNRWGSRSSNWDKKVIYEAESHAWNILGEDNTFTKTLIVTDVPVDKVNVVKTYAKEWLYDESNPYEYVVASVKSEEEVDWFSYGKNSPSLVPTMNYTDYRAKGLVARKARLNVSAGSRAKTQYDCLQFGRSYSTLMTAAEINALGKRVLWHRGGFNQSKLMNGTSPLSKLWKTDKYVLVSITGSKSVDVFQRNVPNSESLSDLSRVEAQKIFDAQTPADTKILLHKSDGGSDYNTGLTFVRAHRDKITNNDVLKYVDAASVQTKTLTAEQQTRFDLLQSVYSVLSKPLPKQTRPSDVKWFYENLPFVALALYNSYQAERVLGTREKIDTALIDYINSTNVSLV